MTVTVAEQVDNGIQVTADFPTLKGDASSDFTYNLTITNNTPEEQTFTFDPSGPEGWTVTASPTAEARAETVNIEAGATGQVQGEGDTAAPRPRRARTRSTSRSRRPTEQPARSS